jgi:hypothetical protein
MRDRGTMQAVGLAAQLGFAIACPMLACVGGGYWADQQLNTRPWLVLGGIAVGLLLAFGTLYSLTRMAFGARKPAAPGASAPGSDVTDRPILTLEGPRPTGTLQVRLNNALDDLLQQLERVGDAESLAQARALRTALAPAGPDLTRLLAIQQYFAEQPVPVRNAADHFFSDPVVSEIINTIK